MTYFWFIVAIYITIEQFMEQWKFESESLHNLKIMIAIRNPWLPASTDLFVCFFIAQVYISSDISKELTNLNYLNEDLHCKRANVWCADQFLPIIKI